MTRKMAYFICKILRYKNSQSNIIGTCLGILTTIHEIIIVDIKKMLSLLLYFRAIQLFDTAFIAFFY